MNRAVLPAIAVVLMLSIAWVADQLQRRPDLAPYREHFVTPAEPAVPGGVTVTFFGISTLLIADGETALMTDGFFTRPGVTTLLFGRLMPDRELIGTALAQAGITRLAAVIPVHSHHDHAMDAPEVARRTGAVLLGSESSANIGRGWGLPERQIRVAASGEPHYFGRFKVTLLPTGHAPMPALVARISGHGKTIDRPLEHPARLSAYKEGGSYAVLVEHPRGNLLIQGSAGFVEGMLDGFRADTVFLGIAGLSQQPAAYRHAYYRETVTAVGASRVVPIHWDDFTLPYTRPLQPMSGLISDFDTEMGFVLERAAANPGTRVTILPRWGDSLHL